MEVMLSNRLNSGRAIQSEAVHAVRIAEESGLQPMLLAYHPVANVNPYQALTYRRFAQSGIGVIPLYRPDDTMSLTRLVQFGVPVAFHLHWTGWIINGAGTADEAQERVDNAIAWLSALRDSGVKLIWTLHNVLPHDAVFAAAEARFQQWLADTVDVLHVLNANTESAVKNIMNLPKEKVVCIPHPNYVGAYPDFYSQQQARALLDIDPDEVVYVIAGAIKSYKGIGKLIPALDGLATVPPRRLIVAGKPDSSDEALAFVRECERHARVLIDARTVPESEMQIYLRAADMAILPYERSLNSGAALLALSFGLPVVAPAIGAMAEILTYDCAQTFDPAATDGFARALAKADRLLTKHARQSALDVAARYDADTLSNGFAAELRRRLLGLHDVVEPTEGTGTSDSRSARVAPAVNASNAETPSSAGTEYAGEAPGHESMLENAAPTTATVGLVGFFGWGNYGDELFLKVWHEYLGPHVQLKVLHDSLDRPHFTRPVHEAVDEVDAILIGGGDLVIPWKISDLYWKNEYLDRPVYIAGVGVPTWQRGVPAVIERMRQFVQHPNVRYISARDPESAQWITRNLQPHVEVAWAPDLVFASTLPEVKRVPGEKVLSIATRYRRRGEDDLTQLHRLADKAISMGWKVNNIVLATGRTAKADLEVARTFEPSGVEIIHSEDLDEITRAVGAADLLASMKFHGTVVATAYGVPTIPIAATDKSKNLFRMIDRLPLIAGLQDPTIPDRLHSYLLPVPRIVRNHLRWRSVKGVHQLRDAILKDHGAPKATERGKA